MIDTQTILNRNEELKQLDERYERMIKAGLHLAIPASCRAMNICEVLLAWRFVSESQRALRAQRSVAKARCSDSCERYNEA
jgi:hypothetical protein